MSELGPIAKLLIESAREGFGPDDVAIARMRAHVATAIAAGTAGVTVTAAAAATPPAAGAGAAGTIGVGVAKLVALVVAAGIATGAIVMVATREGRQPAAARAPRVQELRVTATPITPPPAERPDPAPAVVAPASIAKPKVVRPRSEVTPPQRSPASEPAPASPRLAREVVLIDEATDALRLGRAADAIATVGAYERETSGRGQLAEDAAAIELEALCALHESFADKLAEFDRRWPASTERERVIARCGAR